MRALSAVAAALAISACAHASSGVASKEAIQWSHDDYDAARAKALAEGKPLFVDVWATWCHSCLSMQRYVFSDPGMAPVKDAAVFVALDQELPRNRPFVTQYPIDGLPTFFSIDPKDGKIIARWLGSGSVADLRGFIEQAAAEVGSKDPASAFALARAGDEKQQQGDAIAASESYEAALKKSGQGDRFRPQLLVKLASALGQTGRAESQARCVALGLAELPGAANGSLAADFATASVECAQKAAGGDELRAKAEVKLLQIADDPAAPLSADDRSDAMGSLVSMLDQDGRKDDALALSKRRRDLLLAAQKAAPDVETASTFDGHLTETYLRLGELAPAEALLAAHEKAMPTDFNPPARLARILLEEKKLPEADAAVARALALMTEGPRRAGILSLQGRILEAEGKSPEPALREELKLLQSLPKPQQRPAREAQIRARLQISAN